MTPNSALLQGAEMETARTSYPRVLVLCDDPFHCESGGGVTMGNLFRGWPRDSLAQVYSCTALPRDTTVCTTYRHFAVAPPTRPTSLRSSLYYAATVAGFLTGRFEALGMWCNTSSLVSWVRGFAPDVIYARPVDAPCPCYCRLPRMLSRKLGIPYVVHIMDDWPRRYELRSGPLNNLVRKPRMRRAVWSLLSGAAERIAISDEMCEAYLSRYDLPFVPFANCIDIHEWREHGDLDAPPGDPFTITYIGVVTSGKELESLCDVADAVRALKGRGQSVRMVIHAAESYRSTIRKWLESPPAVVYGGFLNRDKLPWALAKADALLLPINFDERSQAYIGYSLQTKVPEYMASGTPILVYGPRSSPNVRYALQGGWGLVVDRQDQGTLVEAITTLMDDTGVRRRLANRARELATVHHDGNAVRERFRTLLARAAQVWSATSRDV